MTRWLVKIEFVPDSGAAPRTDAEVLAASDKIEQALSGSDCRAHGNATRLVVGVKLEADSLHSARGVGSDLIEPAVRAAGLTDWHHEAEWWQAWPI